MRAARTTASHSAARLPRRPARPAQAARCRSLLPAPAAFRPAIQKAYPELKPLRLPSMGQLAAFEAAAAEAKAHGWEIVSEDRCPHTHPVPCVCSVLARGMKHADDAAVLGRSAVAASCCCRASLTLQAVDTTLLLRFKDDIVVRVTQPSDAGGAQVDARSRSRVGKGDLVRVGARRGRWARAGRQPPRVAGVLQLHVYATHTRCAMQCCAQGKNAARIYELFARLRARAAQQ